MRIDHRCPSRSKFSPKIDSRSRWPAAFRSLLLAITCLSLSLSVSLPEALGKRSAANFPILSGRSVADIR